MMARQNTATNTSVKGSNTQWNPSRCSDNAVQIAPIFRILYLSLFIGDVSLIPNLDNLGEQLVSFLTVFPHSSSGKLSRQIVPTKIKYKLNNIRHGSLWEIIQRRENGRGMLRISDCLFSQSAEDWYLYRMDSGIASVVFTHQFKPE